MHAILLLMALAFGAETLPVPYSDRLPDPYEEKPKGIFDYNRSWEAAAKNQRPFVAFVRLKSFAVDGCEVATTDLLFPLMETGVVVAVPDGNGGLKVAAELHGVQTAAQIEAAVKSAMEPHGRPRLFNLLPPPVRLDCPT